MKIKLSQNFHGISVLPEQMKQISSFEKINNALKNSDSYGFDIFNDDNKKVGFALLKKFGENQMFLWDYIIDFHWQNKGIGTHTLKLLFELLKNQYNINTVTTTYIWGNQHAKHIYENLGFKETNTVNEDGIHEVNMIITL